MTNSHLEPLDLERLRRMRTECELMEARAALARERFEREVHSILSRMGIVEPVSFDLATGQIEPSTKTKQGG